MNFHVRIAMTIAWTAVLPLSLGAGAAQPLQTASTVSAALPDIVGLRPGVSFQAAYTFLKSYDQLAKVGVGAGPLQAFGSKPVPFMLVLGQDGASSAELIEADVTLPPGQQVVWKVSRELRFAPGKQTTAQNLVATLRQKYGPEGFLTQSTTPTLYWFYDEQGRRVTEVNGMQVSQCTTLADVSTVNYGPLLNLANSVPYPLIQIQPLDDREAIVRCRPLVILVARMDRAADLNLIGMLSVAIADRPLEARAHKATLEFMAHGADAQRQQELDRANQQAKPKL